MRFIVSSHVTNNGGYGSVSLWPDNDTMGGLVMLTYDGRRWRLSLSGIEKDAARQVVDEWVASMFEEATK